MTKLIKIVDQDGKEVSPAELVDSLRNQLAEKLRASEPHTPEATPEAEDTKPKEDVKPSSDQENKDLADARATFEELFGAKFEEEEAPSEDKDTEEEALATHEAKLAERKAKIDEFFKDAEAELPRVKAHVRNAALITAGVAAGVGALAVVAVKHALRK